MGGSVTGLVCGVIRGSGCVEDGMYVGKRVCVFVVGGGVGSVALDRIVQLTYGAGIEGCRASLGYRTCI